MTVPMILYCVFEVIFYELTKYVAEYVVLVHT
jgi:hypothetical protein